MKTYTDSIDNCEIITKWLKDDGYAAFITDPKGDVIRDVQMPSGEADKQSDAFSGKRIVGD